MEEGKMTRQTEEFIGHLNSKEMFSEQMLMRRNEIRSVKELVNNVVARFTDGRIVKGTTADFFPTKDFFHVSVATAPAGAKPVEINKNDLKALFFVKDFTGNPHHVERNEFDPSNPPAGRRIRVEFSDGEVLVGTTTGYQPGRQGFFVVPADAGSNIDRCYVVMAATRKVSFL
jgi:Family of unknown function (DUF6982)